MPKQKKTQLRIDLEKEYRRLAKQADERLVRLEKLSKEAGYEKVTEYAYRVAMRDIRSWSGSEARRFNRKPPKNTNQLKAKIADIKKFLDSVTSTKSGIKQIYDKRVTRFNKDYGTDFSSEELAEFFRSTLYKKMDAKPIDSDVIFRSVGEMSKNKDEIKAAIAEHRPIHISTNDMHVQDTIDKFVRTRLKKHVTDFFGAL